MGEQKPTAEEIEEAFQILRDGVAQSKPEWEPPNCPTARARALLTKIKGADQ